MAELSSSRYYSYTSDDDGEEEEEGIDPAPARNSFLPLTVDRNPNAPRYIKSDSFEDLLARSRVRLMYGVESCTIKIVSLAVLLLYIAVVCAELALALTDNQVTVSKQDALEVVSLLCGAYCYGEAFLRLVGLGSQLVRKRWVEVVDVTTVAVANLITIILAIAFDANDKIATSSISKGEIFLLAARLVIIVRVIRMVAWIRQLREREPVTAYIRKKVSRNRRRYTEGEFDLDLTYVTDRIIAIGSILGSKHNGHYCVYNLCSEKEYDTRHFHHQVRRILIDDHNVAKFTDMIDFCNDVAVWMEKNPDNVIVVHCKGGKGRTGMMVAALLVHSGQYGGAKQSLDHFRYRRTDISQGKESQGVDTPSQSRYVGYYEKLLNTMSGNLPPPVTLKVKQIAIYGLKEIGRGDGMDWSFEVFQVRDKILEFSFHSRSNHTQVIVPDAKEEAVRVVFLDSRPLLVTDDVRFKFYCSTKTVPCGSDKCHFYFWFNTAFVENKRLFLKRNELDNLQKSKIRRLYPIQFSVEINFEPVLTPLDNTLLSKS
eukprot:Em0022g50a